MAERLSVETWQQHPDALRIQAGLSRVTIAINAAQTGRYIIGFSKLREPLLGYVHSLKVPREATIERRKLEANKESESLVVSFETLSAMLASKKKVPPLCIDTKFSNDGNELPASVYGLRTESDNFIHDVRAKRRLDERQKARLEEMQRQRRAITFLMHHMVDPTELQDAVMLAREWYDPIAVVSSSKQAKKTNSLYGLHHRDLTVSMSAMALDAGITHLTASANDAELVRDALSSHPRYGELVISGTGAVLDQSDIGEHDAPSSVRETSHAVDLYVLGKAVFFNDDPETRLLGYAHAIGSK